MELNVMRVEKKYLVDEAAACLLRSHLQAVVPKDPMSGENGYTVRSLYFDTPYDSDYRDKQDGLNDRKKIRLRIYAPDDAAAKLELKAKHGQNQLKRSLTIPADDAKRLIRGDYGVLAAMDAPLAQELYAIMQTGAFVPKTIVEFKRAAYMLPTNNIRVTFDTRLQATEACFDLFSDKLAFYPILLPVILEVKYHHFLLEHVKRLIAGINESELSVSKYCLARQISYY